MGTWKCPFHLLLLTMCLFASTMESYQPTEDFIYDDEATVDDQESLLDQEESNVDDHYSNYNPYPELRNPPEVIKQGYEFRRYDLSDSRQFGDDGTPTNDLLVYGTVAFSFLSLISVILFTVSVVQALTSLTSTGLTGLLKTEPETDAPKVKNKSLLMKFFKAYDKSDTESKKKAEQS
ncbi:Uncharacterised protein r2_g4197 [Pycnogonum litorale]